MYAITRQPRLLVKTRAMPPQASLSFRNKPRGVRFEPLFRSMASAPLDRDSPPRRVGTS